MYKSQSFTQRQHNFTPSPDGVTAPFRNSDQVVAPAWQRQSKERAEIDYWSGVGHAKQEQGHIKNICFHQFEPFFYIE